MMYEDYGVLILIALVACIPLVLNMFFTIRKLKNKIHVLEENQRANSKIQETDERLNRFFKAAITDQKKLEYYIQKRRKKRSR